MSYAQTYGGYGYGAYDGSGGYYGSSYGYNAYGYGYGLYAYGYGYYGYGYGDYGYDPVSSYRTTTRNDDTGTTYQHVVYADALGHYYRSFYEVRTGDLDTITQYRSTYYGGVYYTDYSTTYTPIDGVYASTGTRDITSYDLNAHTATSNHVYFNPSLSTSYFTSHDYSTGAFVISYDVRNIYGGGYYETLQTYYHGPGGSNGDSVSGYHYNT